MIMKSLATGLTAVVIAAVAGFNVHAIGAPAKDGFKDVAALLFISQDADNDTLVSKTEAQGFAETAFVSMDADDNGSIDPAEFLAWDPGFVVVAQQTGKGGDVDAVKLKAFAAADTDGSDTVDLKEMTDVTESGFYAADADGNAALTLEEFTGGFPIVAYIGVALSS